MHSTLSAIELDMLELSKNKYSSVRPEPVERSSEDDAAIAQVISEVEHELQRENASTGYSALIKFTAVAAIVVAFLYFKFV